MLTILAIIVLIVYSIGFTGLATIVWLLSGGGWKAVFEAIVVASVWPYVLWDWTK